MNENKKRIIFGILLSLGIIIFILQFFIFQAPDGIFGFFICLISIEFIIISLIKLCQSSEQFRKSFARFLYLIFRIPF